LKDTTANFLLLAITLFTTNLKSKLSHPIMERSLFVLVLATLLPAWTVLGFQVPIAGPCGHRRTAKTAVATKLNPNASTILQLSTQSTMTTTDPPTNALNHDEEQPQDTQQQQQFPLTPMQIKTLRKETSRRQAWNTMATVILPAHETMGPFSDETVAQILSLLEQEELVEVRGLARSDDESNNKKHVHGISELLLLELNRQNMVLVERVITKGHATVFFASTTGTLIVRTSYRPNAWTKKIKPPRDHRGQIIL
jgi:hypothetical protein